VKLHKDTYRERDLEKERERERVRERKIEKDREREREIETRRERKREVHKGNNNQLVGPPYQSRGRCPRTRLWFLVCYAATQLALQLQQERIQVVCSNKLARKCLTVKKTTSQNVWAQINSNYLIN